MINIYANPKAIHAVEKVRIPLHSGNTLFAYTYTSPERVRVKNKILNYNQPSFQYYIIAGLFGSQIFRHVAKGLISPRLGMVPVGGEGTRGEYGKSQNGVITVLIEGLSHRGR